MRSVQVAMSQIFSSWKKEGDVVIDALQYGLDTVYHVPHNIYNADLIILEIYSLYIASLW